jgi:hypothetical protein
LASPRRRNLSNQPTSAVVPEEWPTGQLAAEPWLKWPQEKPDQYYAFCAYRDMPPGKRSVERAYAYMRTGDPDEKVRCHPGWHNYRRAFRWDERIDAYERTLERKHLAAMDDQVLNAYKEMGERHAREAMALQAKALERLRGLDPASMNADQVLRFIVQAATLERLARGASLQDLQNAQRDREQSGATITYVDDWRGDQQRLERLKKEGSRYGNGQGVLPADVRAARVTDSGSDSEPPEEVQETEPAVTIVPANGRPETPESQSWWKDRLERPIGDDPWNTGDKLG